MLTSLKLDKPASLAELATNRLREAIVSGRFKPGERLVESSVSESFGISRAPLREALRLLTADGLVELRQGKGAYVISPSTQQLEHMILTRAVAEGVAGRLIAAERVKATLERLQTILAAHESAQDARDGAELVRQHWRFHQALCEECGNPNLLQVWGAVSSVLRIYSALAVYRLAFNANRTFFKYLSERSPLEAETLLRSQILFTSYAFIKRPIPAAIVDYVSQYIDPSGKVVPIRPRQLNDTLVAFERAEGLVAD